VIKRIYLPYLDASHFALVSQLQRGERTPLFSIRDGKYDRYSWFQRLAMPRAMEARTGWDCAPGGACGSWVRAGIGNCEFCGSALAGVCIDGDIWAAGPMAA